MRQILARGRTYYLRADGPEEVQLWKQKLELNKGIWDEQLSRFSIIHDDGSIEEGKAL